MSDRIQISEWPKERARDLALCSTCCVLLLNGESMVEVRVKVCLVRIDSGEELGGKATDIVRPDGNGGLNLVIIGYVIEH